MKAKRGFSLLELIMVLAVASSISFMKFQDLKKEQENIIADAVGQQIKQVGSAVNGYINIRYDKLSTLTNSSGGGTDPGPRTCSTAANTCTISYQTLINEGLLPSSFNGINANKSAYSIILKRSGSSPNYIINGLVTTNSSWTEGAQIRYDLLGKAMQAAGVDSGMTKSAATVSGYSGSWSEQSSTYTTINKAGVLGYRVGYDSSMYSVFLRRDGTLPMTGDLNMGTKSINNAANINASGTTTSAVLKSTGTTNVGTNLTVNGITSLIGATTLGATLTVNGASNLKGATNISNNLTVTGNEQVNGTIVSNNRITGKEIYSNSETYTTNWFRTMGDGGIYFQKYGGGWNMTNTSTITAYGGKNVQTTGGFYGGYIKSTGNIDATGNIISSSQVKGSTLVSTGRSTVGEFLQINGVGAINGACSPNGLQGRTSAGAIISCVNGKWTAASISGSYTNIGTFVGAYNGVNNRSSTLTVFINGGQSTVNRGVQDGSCVNTWELTGRVNGNMVAHGQDNNVSWAKSGFITFMVPPNTSYSITSAPNPTEGCGTGRFNVMGYQ